MATELPHAALKVSRPSTDSRVLKFGPLIVRGELLTLTDAALPWTVICATPIPSKLALTLILPVTTVSEGWDKFRNNGPPPVVAVTLAKPSLTVKVAAS